MEFLVAIPLKKTYEVDLVKYLKVSINAQYGNVDEKSKDNLEVMNRMRNNATSRNIESSQETSLEIIEKYYDQLVLLNNKLPQANVPFKWKDAFEKGGIFSSSSMTVSNLSFEKVCIMFNIGALMSTLGAYYCKEGAFNDNSLKQAIKHFQGAAGIFQALKHTTSSSSDGNELTFDLQTEVLNMLQHMMLAQAQEAFFFKAYNDGMKENSVARIAAQCVEFYGEVEKQIQSINFKDKSFLPEWVDIIIQKHNAYKGVAEYYQAMVAKDKKEFGEQITRLTKALEFFKSAETRVAISMAEKFKDIVNKATLALEEVKRDNDFIYHARIPDYKSLPTISKALLAKSTELPNLFFPNESDLFVNLLPLVMHQSISRLENRKQELVNGEIGQLRDMTQTLSGILASLNLPAAIEDTQGVEVPKSIEEKATAIRQKGGIEEINRLINELPDLLKRNREILDEIERSLNAEEESDSKLRGQFKEKWTRTPSNKLNQTWRSHISKYRTIIEKAIEADKKLKVNYDSNIEKIKLLSSPATALASAIPSNQASGSSVDDSAVQSLRQLMIQVDALKRERESLENELKNIEFEELRKQFLNYLNVNTGVDETSVAAEVIGSAYNELQKKVRQSKEKQERLITEIQEANQKFVVQRGSSGSKRDQFLKDCAAAYEAYTQLLSNLKEGNKFYNDLTQLLVNLQVKVNDFCFARKAEREELCKDLQNDIVSKPNDPVPKIPDYQKPDSGSSSSVPPAAPYQQFNPYQAPGYNYYPPPPLPQGFNPFVMPQPPPVAYYPAPNYQYPPQGGHPQPGSYPYQPPSS
ncbi:programmed cell death 6-interacting protein [Dermatophagoides farinae]|uniref:Programmed cell death 6-interacting protein-like protein n=1 Tax=Dermatophagoides farinae TaxID=6954 RepID=A0A9D4NWY5_DERFA|nr:programmed cell death 6-interacting protein-like isoform X1 [Dermatophagoides farinae]XP_046915545.1 programmed cell death 6-interacting protein-like isoform X2 [Dermatophagoides farinae]KAH7640785.1 programmed cell death 6-interacting protein-like protein [Dermatophagoides farinae]